LKPEDFLRSASARVEAARVVGNALNPLPWLTGIVSPLSLVLAVWTSDVFFREALFGLAALPVLVTIVAYFIILVRDPHRLQSEEYQLRQRALKMLYRRGANARAMDATREIASMEKNIGSLDKGDFR